MPTLMTLDGPHKAGTPGIFHVINPARQLPVFIGRTGEKAIPASLTSAQADKQHVKVAVSGHFDLAEDEAVSRGFNCRIEVREDGWHLHAFPTKHPIVFFVGNAKEVIEPGTSRLLLDEQVFQVGDTALVFFLVELTREQMDELRKLGWHHQSTYRPVAPSQRKTR